MNTTHHISPDLASSRRVTFLGLSLVLTVAAFFLLLQTYSGHALTWTDDVTLALFPLIFLQISSGFILAILGFYDWLRGGDPYHLFRQEWRKKEDTLPLAATAVVIPVFNEDVGRVARGITQMWQSISQTGQTEHFDFYLLSDSNDPDSWVEEECAWMSLCQKLNAFGKIFYRKRRHAINGKSGNVADFCRRWGKRYRYMVVLDADSIMTGHALVRLVRAMEANPQVGILQTLPHMALGHSLFRRMQQFSSRLSSSLFTQGFSYAQMASGSYWGHNAIIRVAPFIEYCDLPELPVPDRERRHVLSHDTVEAALMCRAGYEVWLAYDLAGSYEEGPPSLTDMLKRDRRWCAGNLQHPWFLFARGLNVGSRLHIWFGLMAYLSSPLWLFFILFGSIGTYEHIRFYDLSAGPEERASISLLPGFILGIVTVVLLFMPRVLGLIISLRHPKLFGGVVPLLASTVLDVVTSVLLAPVLMAFHTIFVFLALSGWKIQWKTQNRSDSGLSLLSCFQTYGWLSLLGWMGLAAAWFFLQQQSYWLWPIFFGWICAPGLAWFTSKEAPGRLTHRLRLFCTPEECRTPEELKYLEAPSEKEKIASCWSHVLLNPYVQALHLSIIKQRPTAEEETVATSLHDLAMKLIKGGASVLTNKEKLRILWDAETVSLLHRELWTLSDEKLHSSWPPLLAASAHSPLLHYLIPETVANESVKRSDHSESREVQPIL